MTYKPLLRLRDDPAVSRTLRDDLARESVRAGDYDVATGLAQFERTLGAGGAGGHDGGAAQGSAGAAGKTVLGAALKGALIGLALVGGAEALPDRTPPASSAPLASAPIRAPHLEQAPAALAETPARPAPTPSPDPEKPAASTAPLHRSASPQPAPPPPDGTAPDAAAAPAPPLPAPAPSASDAPAPRAEDALAAEMEHLVRLRAIQNGDPAQALAFAAEGSRRFPAGYFAQEREAIAVAALVRLGRVAEARARAGAFLAAYPRSAFAERIRELSGIRGAP